MNKLRRCNFLFAILVVSAGLAAAQVQEKSAVDDPAMGPDYQQGKSALAAQKYEEAVKAFKKANKLQNDACSPCLTQIAYAQARMGDTRGALNSAEKALAAAKSNEQRADAHALKGDILLGENDEKKRAEAEAEYLAAIQQNTQVAENHLKLAVALKRSERYGSKNGAQRISEARSRWEICRIRPRVAAESAPSARGICAGIQRYHHTRGNDFAKRAGRKICGT